MEQLLIVFYGISIPYSLKSIITGRYLIIFLYVVQEVDSDE